MQITVNTAAALHALFVALSDAATPYEVSLLNARPCDREMILRIVEPMWLAADDAHDAWLAAVAS